MATPSTTAAFFVLITIYHPHNSRMMRSKSTIVSRHHGLGHQQYNNNNNGHNVRKPRSPSTFIKPSQHRSFSFPFYRALRSWKSLNMPLQRSTSMKEPLPLAPSANLQFPRPSSPYVDPLAKQYQPSVVNDVEMSVRALFHPCYALLNPL